jgi:hypothetical protein
MSFGGGQRKQIGGAARAPDQAKRLPPPIPPRASRFGKVQVEYIGPTGLTVRGRISGQIYRFPETGARVAVDTRDVPSLLGVPQLRRVPSPRPSPA